MRVPKVDGESAFMRKTNKLLPRSNFVYTLYEYSVPEHVYQVCFVWGRVGKNARCVGKKNPVFRCADASL